MKIRLRGLAFRLTINILLGVIIIFGGIMMYNYHESRKLVIHNAEQSAREQTTSAVREIEKILLKVEKVPQTLARILEQEDLSREKIQQVFTSILEDTPEIFGICIGFEPHAYYADSLYFAPYAWRKGGSFSFENIGGPHYDYFFIDWYQIPKMLGEAVWAEPYFDEFGGDALMSTYGVPFHRIVDGESVFQGIVTADISLVWLKEIVDSLQVYEGGFSFLLSRNGVIVTHPRSDFIMNHSIFSLAEEANQPYLREIGRSMQRLESGFHRVQPLSIDQVSWMVYEPLRSNRWALAVIFPEEELFADLVSLNRQILLLGLLGLVFLILIISVFAKKITEPLGLLVVAAERMGKGDLAQEIPAFKTMDEVATMAKAFQGMKTELQQYIAQLKDTTAAKEKIESELRIAHDIQMGIIPRIFPPFPDRPQLDLYAILDPAREVGGDLYDFFFMDQDHLCIAIGDVSGKGIPASLLMAISRTLLRAKATPGSSVSEIITAMNNELCEENENAMFVTFILAMLDVKTGELEYCNAGHNYPCIYHPSGQLEWISETHGIPLGLFHSEGYAHGRIKLTENDILMLYTDGVTEAMDEEDALFGEERMENLINSAAWNNARILTEALVKEVKDFCGTAEQSDDITLLNLHWKGNRERSVEGGEREIRLRNVISEIALVDQLLEELARDWEFDENLRFELNLILEELITNIIFYAYDDQHGHEIRIILSKLPNRVVVRLEDDGRPFDPLSNQETIDVSKPLEEREIGGLGIHFVRNLAEELHYQRLENKNILTFTKRINN